MLKFRGKILLPNAILTILLLILTLSFSIVQFSSFTEYLLERRLETAANAMRGFSYERSRLTMDIGMQVARDPRII